MNSRGQLDHRLLTFRTAIEISQTNIHRGLVDATWRAESNFCLSDSAQQGEHHRHGHSDTQRPHPPPDTDEVLHEGSVTKSLNQGNRRMNPLPVGAVTKRQNPFEEQRVEGHRRRFLRPMPASRSLASRRFLLPLEA